MTIAVLDTVSTAIHDGTAAVNNRPGTDRPAGDEK